MEQSTIQVINGPDFIKMLKDAVLDASFVDILKATGLAEVPLDKHATKYILGISSDSAIEKYCKVGKEDNMRVLHKLKRFYEDKNKPRFKLIDVLEFNRIK